MSKLSNSNILATIMTLIYLITFIISFNSNYNWCHYFNTTIFIIPWFTAYGLSYDGQPDIVVWSAIIMEMVILFLLLRLIIITYRERLRL